MSRKEKFQRALQSESFRAKMYKKKKFWVVSGSVLVALMIGAAPVCATRQVFASDNTTGSCSVPEKNVVSGEADQVETTSTGNEGGNNLEETSSDLNAETDSTVKGENILNQSKVQKVKPSLVAGKTTETVSDSSKELVTSSAIISQSETKPRELVGEKVGKEQSKKEANIIKNPIEEKALSTKISHLPVRQGTVQATIPADINIPAETIIAAEAKKIDTLHSTTVKTSFGQNLDTINMDQLTTSASINFVLEGDTKVGDIYTVTYPEGTFSTEDGKYDKNSFKVVELEDANNNIVGVTIEILKDTVTTFTSVLNFSKEVLQSTVKSFDTLVSVNGENTLTSSIKVNRRLGGEIGRYDKWGTFELPINPEFVEKDGTMETPMTFEKSLGSFLKSANQLKNIVVDHAWWVYTTATSTYTIDYGAIGLVLDEISLTDNTYGVSVTKVGSKAAVTIPAGLNWQTLLDDTTDMFNFTLHAENPSLTEIVKYPLPPVSANFFLNGQQFNNSNDETLESSYLKSIPKLVNSENSIGKRMNLNSPAGSSYTLELNQNSWYGATSEVAVGDTSTYDYGGVVKTQIRLTTDVKNGATIRGMVDVDQNLKNYQESGIDYDSLSYLFTTASGKTEELPWQLGVTDYITSIGSLNDPIISVDVLEKKNAVTIESANLGGRLVDIGAVSLLFDENQAKIKYAISSQSFNLDSEGNELSKTSGKTYLAVVYNYLAPVRVYTGNQSESKQSDYAGDILDHVNPANDRRGGEGEANVLLTTFINQIASTVRRFEVPTSINDSAVKGGRTSNMDYTKDKIFDNAYASPAAALVGSKIPNTVVLTAPKYTTFVNDATIIKELRFMWAGNQVPVISHLANSADG